MVGTRSIFAVPDSVFSVQKLSFCKYVVGGGVPRCVGLHPRSSIRRVCAWKTFAREGKGEK